MKSDTVKVVDVRAVDIGYFSTKVSLGRKPNGDSIQIETMSFPSVAPKLSQGHSPEAAMQRKPNGCAVSVAGVDYFVGVDVDAHCSAKEPREVLTNYSETPKYMALFLGALHYIFEDSGAKDELVIKELVLGLPMNTFQSSRKPLVVLTQGEHLLPCVNGVVGKRRVTVEHVTVIAQPQGALLSHGIQNSGTFKQGWILVVDAGGGTLDWFVSRGKLSNWQMSGAYPKSMLACAYEVASRIDKTWRDNFVIISKIDRAIHNDDEFFTVAGIDYKLADHASTIESVVNEAYEKMAASVGPFESMDLILFTGGGGGLFHRHFINKHRRVERIVALDEDPLFSNVRGFQICGEIMQQRKAR